IQALRQRVLRSMLATVFVSHGTPMLLAGDEFGNSQQGNNNAYCQDNEISWLDWSRAATAEGRELTAFVAKLAALRRAHPSLRFARYVDGNHELLPGLARVSWFDLDGGPMSPEAWDYAPGRVLGLRRAAETAEGLVDLSLLLLNGGGDDVRFQLPEPAFDWTLRLDTANPGSAAEPPGGEALELRAHSLMVLTATHEPRAGHG